LPLEEDEGKKRWAGPLVGFSRERRGGGLGWKRPKAREVIFSLKIIFYFCFSKFLCYFIKRVCRSKISYETLFSLLHNK
jgi:hypothetical protein